MTVEIDTVETVEVADEYRVRLGESQMGVEAQVQSVYRPQAPMENMMNSALQQMFMAGQQEGGNDWVDVDHFAPVQEAMTQFVAVGAAIDSFNKVQEQEEEEENE